MKKSQYAALVATFVVLSGCASTGNEKLLSQSESSIQQQIVEGKTNKSEVKTILGDATSVTFTDSGNEVWNYQHLRATPKAINFIPIANLFVRGADVKKKEFIVMFDKAGIVSRYTMRETQEEIKAGLAQ